MTLSAVSSPGTEAYTAAVGSFSLLRTPSPTAAVVARSVGDVQEAVLWAAERGMRVAAFTTGHGAGRLGGLADALLVRVALDEPVTIDPAARTARIPAGALWREVVEAASAHGLLAPHGSSGTVGAVGYLINGGLGFTARALGVAANAVLGAEYVDGRGRLRRCDAREDADVLWALRGGGAGVGAVTALTVRLHPGEQVVSGARLLPADRAGDLLRAWRDWCADAPRSISTSARILRLPPLPHLPPFLTAGPVVAVDGVALDGDGDADRVVATLLEPLAAIADPLLDTWHRGPAADALAAHMDPEDPAPAWTDHDLLSDLPDSAIDLVVEAATGPSPLLSHELRQLGGAVADPAEPGGFFDRVAEPWLFNGVAIAPEPAVLRAAQAHVAGLRSRLAQVVHDRCVPTFLEGSDDVRLAADAPTTARLRAVRAAADPDGRFAVHP